MREERNGKGSQKPEETCRLDTPNTGGEGNALPGKADLCYLSRSPDESAAISGQPNHRQRSWTLRFSSGSRVTRRREWRSRAKG